MKKITYWLAILLIFTIPFKEILVLPGLGSVSRLLGLLVAGFWLLLVILSGQLRRPSLFHWAAFAFFLWNVASIMWTLDATASIERASTYVRMAFFIWFIWDLFDTRKAIWQGCQAYVLGAWVTIGSLFFNYFNNIEAYNSSGGRFAATGFNTNETGLLLALGLPLAWYLAVSRPDSSNPMAVQMPKLLRWLNLLYVPIALYSILLTASRGSLIASAPLVLLLFVTVGRTSFGQRVVLIVGIVVAAITFTSVVPLENLERLNTTGDELSASDLNGRVTVWEDGFDVFEENYLLGTGAGTFRKAVETGKAPHNVFVAIGVDLGLVGLTLFGLLLLIAFVALWVQPGVEKFVWFSLLLTWMLGSLVGNWEYENVTWLFLCFIVKGAALYTEQRRADESSVLTATPVTAINAGLGTA